MVDVGLGVQQGDTAADLFALEARHAGGVAEDGGGIVGRGRTAGEGSTHAAHALFVDGETAGQAVGGCAGNSESEAGLYDSCDHG